MSVEEHAVELDEATWVYLAAHRQNDAGMDCAFAEGLAEICESSGFSVFTASDEDAYPSGRWLEALRHAEICVIGVGASSAVGGAELAMAYCLGRPLIALRVRDERLPSTLSAILEHHPAAREIAFDDLSDCSEKLREVFADPAWQQLVRHATVVEDL